MHARNNSFYTILATSSAEPSDFHNSSMLIQVSKNCDSTIRANLGTRAPVDSEPRKLVVGSCNGLLCLAERRRPGLDRISISNPITNESTVVAYSSYDGNRIKARYRFGYTPSTNEYKVLRHLSSIYRELGFPHDPYAIFTVGVDGSWRNLPSGLFPNHLWEREGYHSNMAPPPSGSVGAFHWLAGDSPDMYKSSVLAFDVAEEKTRTIPFPRPAERMYMRSLVSDNPLCLYFRDNVFRVVLSMEGGRWGRAVEPSSAFVVLENGDFYLSSIDSLDHAIRCGGLLFWVEGGIALRSHCPKSGEYSAVLFRHDEHVKLLCGFTPSFCSISDIVGTRSN